MSDPKRQFLPSRSSKSLQVIGRKSLSLALVAQTTYPQSRGPERRPQLEQRGGHTYPASSLGARPSFGALARPHPKNHCLWSAPDTGSWVFSALIAQVFRLGPHLKGENAHPPAPPTARWAGQGDSHSFLVVSLTEEAAAVSSVSLPQPAHSQNCSCHLGRGCQGRNLEESHTEPGRPS